MVDYECARSSNVPDGLDCMQMMQARVRDWSRNAHQKPCVQYNVVRTGEKQVTLAQRPTQGASRITHKLMRINEVQDIID